MTKKLYQTLVIFMAFFVVSALVASPAFAAKGGNGTTLAAYKTLDICEVTPAVTDEYGNIISPAVWHYSGVIAIWNQGAIDTVGLAIDDWIQTKVAGGQYYNVYQVPQANFNPAPHNCVAGTTQYTADTYTYFVDGPALDPLYIRNVANITIMNHSNYIGTPFGPSPKDSWTGGEVQPCEGLIYGCTLTQGYWGTYGPPENPHTWPTGFSRDDTFYLSGQTWQGVLDTTAGGNGYYILAYQYIAAVLNKANGASVPTGVQDTLDDAEAWFTSALPGDCAKGGSCGTQKDWGATLDLYNNGLYPGGPPHCE